MIDKAYFHPVYYGNIYFNLIVKVLPTLLWGFFVYKYYYPYYKSCKDCSPLFLVLLLLPNLIILFEVLLNLKELLSFKPQLIQGWTNCLSLFKSNKDVNKNILGTYNFNCDKLQLQALNDISTNLQYKFYYLNTDIISFNFDFYSLAPN